MYCTFKHIAHTMALLLATLATTGTALASGPFLYDTIGTTTATVQWPGGFAPGSSYDGYMLLAKANDTTINEFPLQTVGYSSFSANFSQAPALSTGSAVRLLSIGPADSIAITGLTHSTTYALAVVPFAKTSSGNDTTWYASNALFGHFTTLAQPCNTLPAQPGGLTLLSVNGDSLLLQWQPTTASGYLVLARKDLPIHNGFLPQDSAVYDTLANANYSLAGTLGPNRLLYAGADTALYLSGIDNTAPHYFAVIPYSHCGGTAAYYNRTAYPSISLADANALLTPTVAATNVQFTNVTETSMDVSWLPGNGEARLVIARQGLPVNANNLPQNDFSYPANTFFGTPGTALPNQHYVVYNGAGSTFTLNGLTPGTEYHLAIVEYNTFAGYTAYATAGYTQSTEITAQYDLHLNWVRSTAYDENEAPVADSKAFFDRTGRPLQQQTYQFSNRTTLATQTLQDFKGRDVLQALPAPILSNGFAYQPAFLNSEGGGAEPAPYAAKHFDLPNSHPATSGQVNNPAPVGNAIEGTLGWYYSPNNTWEARVPEARQPYTRIEYYTDGSGQVKRQAGPGNAHRMGSGHETLSGTFPIANQLHLYCSLYTQAFPTLPKPNIKGQATQQVVFDANGRPAVTIADREGEALMAALPGNVWTAHNTKTIDSAQYIDFYLLADGTVQLTGGSSFVLVNRASDDTLAAPGTAPALAKGMYRLTNTGPAPITLAWANSFGAISLSYYDALGRLAVSVSPNGVNQYLHQGVAWAQVDKTTNRYNFRGELVQVTEPDAGTTTFIYRHDGSLRFSQTSLQAQSGHYSFTRYDASHRPIVSGQFLPDTAAGGLPYAQLQNNAAVLNATGYQSPLGTGTTTDAQYTYYDTPDTATVTLFGKTQQYTAGAVTSTTNSHTTTWYGYNELGQLTWLGRQVHGMGGGRTFLVEYTYDFLGNTTQVAYQPGQQSATGAFYHHYTYDADQRLTEVHTSTNGTDLTLQARYYYYLHGPLKRVELADSLQGMDYTYTVQGWLKAMNHADPAHDPGDDGAGNGFRPSI